MSLEPQEQLTKVGYYVAFFTPAGAGNAYVEVPGGIKEMADILALSVHIAERYSMPPEVAARLVVLSWQEIGPPRKVIPFPNARVNGNLIS